MAPVRVQLGPRSYDIAIVNGDARLGAFVRERLPHSKLALVVGDTNTERHARAVERLLNAAGFKTSLATIAAGENSKTVAEASRLYDALYELAADRKTAMIAVGGGVVGDLAGFAAATYNRGL